MLVIQKEWFLKVLGGNPFNLVEQLKDGGITSIAVDNKETIFVEAF